MQEKLKQIPQVDRLLLHQDVAPLREKYPGIMTHCAREAVEEVREKILAGKAVRNPETLARKLLLSKLKDVLSPKLRPVINATGIILHTGLGRAPLAPSAQENLSLIARGYCNLEYNIETGARGQRLSIVDSLLCELTGAEASAVVNNNAAAVLLVLNSIAFRKEVIVSRGELVEIGGSFRIPEVIKKSGAKLVEVGTTNKTRLQDYAEAISVKTSAILKVHTSNYRVMGFTESVDVKELVALGKDKKMPVIADLGSGALVDLRQYGLPYEPVASEYISAEVDLATFSGDKVLGGPQAGIIVGKKWAVDKCRKNHLMRALRCDKLTLAALEATLKTYLSPAELLEQNPTLKLLAEPVEQIRQRTEEFRNWLLDQSHPNIISAEVRPSIAQAGSGALPLEKIPSFAIHLKTTSSIVTFARKLRTGNPPVIGTIQNEELVLDFRTIFPSEMEILKKSIINNLTSIKIDI